MLYWLLGIAFISLTITYSYQTLSYSTTPIYHYKEAIFATVY